MTEGPEILGRTITHGSLAYGFRWNVTTHKQLGHTDGDLASLWAHLSAIHANKFPEEPFTTPFYTRASSLRLPKMSNMKLAALRNKLFKHHAIRQDVNSPLVSLIREFHRFRNDRSYAADHTILQEFLHHDPATIAIEVPVWSDRYHLSGHIDLIRYENGHIHVCDYKPGRLETLPKRFMESLPQVSAYGELLAHHIAGTFHSAVEDRLLPKIECFIFDTHSCWSFGAELFVTLQASGLIDGL